MDEITSTKNFFKSHDITLSDYWLTSCIEWFREENPNLNYTLETLHSTVYTQWLLLDLRDVEVSVLPQNIQQKKFVLNNTICLQMLHVQDISQPKYQQIQKIRSSSLLADVSINQEYKPIVTPKRMLQLLLTDGVQEIEAIEYRPIAALNVNLKPGTKIKIVGPITVRRGQMLLEDKHIHILGGEVEELLVTNAFENLLARALKLPENPEPKTVEETVTYVAPVRNTINQCFDNRNSSNTISQNTTNVNINNRNIEVNVNINNRNIERVEFDEASITNEIEMLEEAERDLSNETRDLIICKAVEDKQENIPQNFNNVNCDEEDNDIFEGMDIDAHLDLLDEQHRTSNVCEIVPIKQLLHNKNSISSEQVVINAKFKQVVRKLTVRDDKWLVKLLVTDESGDLEAWIDSTLVSNLIGYVPSAIMNLRHSVANKDENVTATLMKIIGGLKDKLKKIDGKLVINFTSKDDPSIINIL